MISLLSTADQIIRHKMTEYDKLTTRGGKMDGLGNGSKQVQIETGHSLCTSESSRPINTFSILNI